MGTEVPSGLGQYSDAHGPRYAPTPWTSRRSSAGWRPTGRPGSRTFRPRWRCCSPRMPSTRFRRSPSGPGRDPLARVHPERRGSGQGRVRRRPGGSLRARGALFGASRVVLPTRAPGVNLRPSPAATSSTARTRARGRSTRFGDRRTTAMTRSSRSRSTASMGNRIPNVCTDRECSSRSPSFGSSPDRPRSPRPRSRSVSGIHTIHGPKRTCRTTGSLSGRSDISARRGRPTVDAAG